MARLVWLALPDVTVLLPRSHFAAGPIWTGACFSVDGRRGPNGPGGIAVCFTWHMIHRGR